MRKGLRCFGSMKWDKSIEIIKSYNKTNLNIGDFAERKWKFEKKEIDSFLSIVGDLNPIHEDPELIHKDTQTSQIMVPRIYLQIIHM